MLKSIFESFFFLSGWLRSQSAKYCIQQTNEHPFMEVFFIISTESVNRCDERYSFICVVLPFFLWPKITIFTLLFDIITRQSHFLLNNTVCFIHPASSFKTCYSLPPSRCLRFSQSVRFAIVFVRAKAQVHCTRV